MGETAAVESLPDSRRQHRRHLRGRIGRRHEQRRKSVVDSRSPTGVFITYFLRRIIAEGRRQPNHVNVRLSRKRWEFILTLAPRPI